MPCFLAEARPLAFKPPLGFLPSLRCHAAVLAIDNSHARDVGHINVNACIKQDAFTWDW